MQIMQQYKKKNLHNFSLKVDTGAENVTKLLTSGIFFFFSFKSAIGGRRVQGLSWFSVLPLWVLKQQQVSGTIFRAVLTLVNNVGV